MTDTSKITPFIYQVPAAKRLVLRNAWTSSSKEQGRPKGYYVLSEGWRFWLPWIWDIVVGLIDMRPVARDPETFPIQSLDGQKMGLDTRFTTRPMHGYGPKELGDESYLPDDQQPKEDGSPADQIGDDLANNVLMHAIRLEAEGGIDRQKFVDQVVTGAMNTVTANFTAIGYSINDLELIAQLASGELKESDEGKKKPRGSKATVARIHKLPRQLWGWGFELEDGDLKKEDGKTVIVAKKGLAEFSTKDLEELSKEIMRVANAELNKYGLMVKDLSIQGVHVSGVLEAALARRTAATLEGHTATMERAAIQELMGLLPRRREKGQSFPDAIGASVETAAATFIIALNRFLDRAPELLGRSRGKADKQEKPAGESKEKKPASKPAKSKA